nr:nucleotidyltransferase domain-containing protein [uncultured Fretibacterium sp.]
MSSKVQKHPIDEATRNTISSRYKRITKAVNRTFWDSDSETMHSMYVGSYGRGTAIKTSDLDVLIELPLEEYDRFTSVYGNGQSRLLQAVRGAILDTYPKSDIKGDGQVVVVSFADEIVFEILPAFRSEAIWGGDGTYKYPDTHMGGNWMSTNPKAEIDAIKEKDKEENTNHLLTATCQHIRYVRDKNYSSYKLSGIVIDSFVYAVIGGWHYCRGGEERENSMQTYEEHLLQKYNDLSRNGLISPSLRAPGSDMAVDSSKGWDVLGKILNYMVMV